MPRGRKKIKDLVDMLEDPEDETYVGVDYEDILDQIERDSEEDDDDDDDGNQVERDEE
ncbi:MAG: hypothetical protein ACT4NX_06125 [Deltaproteobacteria bacterium]